MADLVVKVVDHLTRRPIKGARVKILDRVEVTDENGEAFFEDLPAGVPLEVVVEEEGKPPRKQVIVLKGSVATLHFFEGGVTPPAPKDFFTVKINVQGKGTTDPQPGVYSYEKNYMLVLTATPEPGWKFDHWAVNGQNLGSDPTVSILVTKDLEIWAIFVEETPIPEEPTEPPEIEEPEPPPSPGTGNPIIDFFGGVAAGVVNYFLQALKVFGQSFKAFVEAPILKALDALYDAIQPGSPEEKVKVRAKRLAQAYLREIEKIARKMQGSSPVISLAPEVAQELLSALLGAQVSIEVASTAADQAQPLRRMGIPDAARNLMKTLGIAGIASAIATMPAQIGILEPLRYWYYKQFTPRIPSLSDLITMLMREVITLDQYIEYAAYHGESKEWALRRWEAHWRLPPMEWIHEAYHRGILSEEEWERYLVWHDFKPEPRPGIRISDLDIVRALRKKIIPRVDVRRAWEFGLITTEEMIEYYRKLGYEDDAELMAAIQIGEALSAERAAVARAAGKLFKKGIWSKEQFIAELKNLGYPDMIIQLWVRRYELEKLAGGGGSEAEETAEELATEVRKVAREKEEEVAG